MRNCEDFLCDLLLQNLKKKIIENNEPGVRRYFINVWKVLQRHGF